jgi:exonuclease SbcD
MSKKSAPENMPENHEPIRVLHFADVHVGMENYGKTDPQSGLSQRVLDFLHRMDEMVAYARENDVDLVIFAGDAFKTRTPNPTFQREFAWRILDLAQLAPVVMLVGNHDLQPNAVKASSIEIYDTLRVSNVKILDTFEVVDVETKRGHVVVGGAPYPIRARILEHVTTRTLSIRETDDLLESELTRILESMAEEADQHAQALGDNVPRLLTGHFTVRGAMWGSERSVMLGRDVQIAPGLLADPNWDYVALGHIHKHQNLTEGRTDAPPLVYSGSLERIDFGEESDRKGFCWVELARDATNWQFIPVEARPMYTLRADCRKDDNPTQTVLDVLRKHDLNEAIVRLQIKLSPETDAMLNDGTIRNALRNANVFHIAGIAREVERPERARLGTNPEGMTHEQLLDAYFKSRDIEPARRERLMEVAQRIMQDEA